MLPVHDRVAQHFSFHCLFVLDDLIIFGLAAFAVQKIVNTRYAAISRMIGGVVLIGLGGWMLAR
ncbi:MAG: hypothetical protein ACR65T_10525 [Methylocystis sp.]|uniref:hypothetical protein n=1 Tax=Methylocystis sp. TaxID=1911079 RepID=UPI003DA59FF2